MSGVVQVAFELPKAIELGLMAGEYVLCGGVVRDKKGRIVKHLKPVAQKAGEQAEGILHKAKAAAKANPKAAIAVGAVAGAAIVAGVGYAAYSVHKESKASEKAVDLARFNAAGNEYLKAVRAQKLTEKAVRELMEAVEELQAQLGGEDAQVEISGKQFARFVRTVHEFTVKFNEANGSKAPKVVRGGAPIHALHRDLASQLQVFQLAA